MTRSDKQRYGAVALLMVGIVLGSALITAFTGVTKREDHRLRIVATFFPVYVAALNVANGVDGAHVVNLTPAQTGCLHDYQLSPDNMITLTGADVLVLNGAGAESFLDNARARFPALPVIDTSEGISLLESAHVHEHEHEEDHHEEDNEEERDELYNEHIWTSPTMYIQQIENLRDGLMAIDPAHADAYQANADDYIKQIDSIRQDLRKAAAALPTTSCITFHDSLTYFSEEIGLLPIAALSMGEEAGVSAADLATAQQAATAAKSVLLLYDNQYSTEYAYVVDNTSFSRILTLDTAVSSNNSSEDKNAWLDAMRHNIEQLKGAAQ